MAADGIVGRNPLPVGDRWFTLLNHFGPASYTQVTPGTSPSGGDVITAQACGLKFIQAVFADLDNTGAYNVQGLTVVGDGTSAILRWLNATGGTEVAGATNLSASSVRVLVIGR